jgi:hypothetical protein
MPADRVRLTQAIHAAYPGAQSGTPRRGRFACTFRVRQGADALTVKIVDPTQALGVREDRKVIALTLLDTPSVIHGG